MEEISSRSQFGKLCKDLGVGVAIEVGTDLGQFACELLKEYDRELICIDSYEPYEWLSGDRTSDLLMAIQALSEYYPRVRIVKEKSSIVAKALPSMYTSRLKFVYIDARHDFFSVQEDIENWWPLVRPGGILSGHDYHECHPGVIKAVDQFVERECLELHLTSEDYIPSWWVVKS